MSVTAGELKKALAKMPDDVELIVRVHLPDEGGIHAHSVGELDVHFDAVERWVNVRLTFDRQTHDFDGYIGPNGERPEPPAAD